MVDEAVNKRVCLWLPPELIAKLDALSKLGVFDCKRSTVAYVAIKHGIRALEKRFADAE